MKFISYNGIGNEGAAKIGEVLSKLKNLSNLIPNLIPNLILNIS
jgi:hypothetical protein